MEIHEEKKMCAKNLLTEAVVALSLSKEWPETSTYKDDLALSVSETLQLPGIRGRQVGADEE